MTIIDRDTIEAGPFLEAFKARGLEVIFFHDVIDEYVLGSLREFDGKQLVSAARGDIELGDADVAPEGEALSEDDGKALCEFLKEHFGDTPPKHYEELLALFEAADGKSG